jgi:hypothetical protein
MSESGQLPAGTTVYQCPLSACEWTYTQIPLSVEQLAASMGEPVFLAALREIMPTENAIRDHLETHTLVEWVQEVQRLHDKAERPRQLVVQWRTAAEALRSTNAAWSSHFFDCANELERLLAP